jgi:ABC-type sugar transport system ATPase subunit
VANIVLEGVSKFFKGKAPAVHSLDLEVEDGEFVVVVGPSDYDPAHARGF